MHPSCQEAPSGRGASIPRGYAPEVPDWNPTALPSQAGRTVVVTGGTAGIGYAVAEQLAVAGARVLLAARSPEKSARAIASIRALAPNADIVHVPLDLASLSSIAAAAAAIRDAGPLSALVNNAGRVVASRRRQVTEDGIESTVGGNAIGHFALTAQVFPALQPGGRVVGVGSLATRIVRLDADDLLSERRYRPFRAYAFSKHAVHAFAFELDRRLRAAGDSRASLLAHPGYAVDELSERRPGITDSRSPWSRVAGVLSAPFAQGKDRGAWPVVRAAIDPAAESGEFYGPAQLVRGLPVVQAPVLSSAAPAFGAQLWSLAERLTGIRFEV